MNREQNLRLAKEALRLKPDTEVLMFPLLGNGVDEEAVEYQRMEMQAIATTLAIAYINQHTELLILKRDIKRATTSAIELLQELGK